MPRLVPLAALHVSVEMKGPPPGGVTGTEAPTGPGDHGPVAYRNIRVLPR